MIIERIVAATTPLQGGLSALFFSWSARLQQRKTCFSDQISAPRMVLASTSRRVAGGGIQPHRSPHAYMLLWVCTQYDTPFPLGFRRSISRSMPPGKKCASKMLDEVPRSRSSILPGMSEYEGVIHIGEHFSPYICFMFFSRNDLIFQILP